MECYYYVYKGPKESLFACYTAASIMIPSYNPGYEKRVPAIKHMYDRRAGYFINPIEEADVHIYSMSDTQINRDEFWTMADTKKKIYYTALGFAKNYSKPVYCKEVCNPKIWPERLAVIIAVAHRRNLMDIHLTNRGLDLNIESSKEAQMDVIKDYLEFDPRLKWDKCMEAFQHVQPKPAWYRKELIRYNQIIGV